jgi:hypothetical protein
MISNHDFPRGALGSCFTGGPPRFTHISHEVNNLTRLTMPTIRCWTDMAPVIIDPRHGRNEYVIRHYCKGYSLAYAARLGLERQTSPILLRV